MNRRLVASGTCCAASALFSLTGSAAAAAQTPLFDTIALSGTGGAAMGYGPSLGTDVFTPQIVLPPTLNANGAVAFLAFVSGADPQNGEGLFTNAGGTLHAAASTRGAGPSANLGSGARFGTFGFFPSFSFNDQGKVAFRIFLAGTEIPADTDVPAIFTDVGGSPAVVARAGSATAGPNLGGGLLYDDLSHPTLSNAGTVTFGGRIAGTGVTNADRQVVSTKSAGNALQTIVRRGDAANGLPAGVAYGLPSELAVNTSGRTTFSTVLQGAAVTASDAAAHFVAEPGGAPVPVTRTGTDGPLGPNLGTGVVFSGTALLDIAVNDADGMAFRSGIAGTGVAGDDVGVFARQHGGPTKIVARRATAGALGPNVGTGITFDSFGAAFIANDGRVAFVATMVGPSPAVTSANDQGLFSGDGQTTTLIAREGLAGGAGLGAGVSFQTFTGPIANAIGTLVFRGTVSGTGVTTANDEGIFASIGGAAPTCIVREGSLLDVDPGVGVDLRRIASFSVQDGGNVDGLRRGLNDSNLVTFALTFSDGTGGVFTASLPEPGLAATLGGPMAYALRRRRRRNVVTRPC